MYLLTVNISTAIMRSRNRQEGQYSLAYTIKLSAALLIEQNSNMGTPQADT